MNFDNNFFIMMTHILLQIDYSWPSKSSSMFNKKVSGCLNGPKGANAIMQTLKQRQWRYIITPSPSINNWSLKFSSSVNFNCLFFSK